MKKALLILALLVGFFAPVCCLGPGQEVNWTLVSQQIDTAALDLQTISSLSIADDCREELLQISEALEMIAPLVANGTGGLDALAVLDSCYDLLGEILLRPDLDPELRDTLIIVKLAINHARPYFG